MLYDAYQAQCDALAPWRLFAEAAGTFLDQSWMALGRHPAIRNTSAALNLFSKTYITHEHPLFGINEVAVAGDAVPVREEITLATPFCNLLHFRKEGVAPQPKMLIVAPMSGHFATLLRGTVATALMDHDVYLTDWINARSVPVADGSFGLDDAIELIISFIRHLDTGISVMAVCQPAVPVLAAISLMAAANDSHTPAAMVLMGGPIDPASNPTEVNRFAQSHDLCWFERHVITRVPARYPGAFRRVYPGFLQLAGFISMNLDRHVSAHWKMFRQLAEGDFEGMAAARAFYDEYSAVMDLPAEFYLQTIERVFQRYDLANGRFQVRGETVNPAAIRRTALMTVEGERDDICAVGQTVAAHDLCSNIPPAMHAHHLQPRVGHYGVFNGKRWETEIYPKVRDFIHAQT